MASFAPARAPAYRTPQPQQAPRRAARPRRSQPTATPRVAGGVTLDRRRGCPARGDRRVERRCASPERPGRAARPAAGRARGEAGRAPDGALHCRGRRPGRERGCPRVGPRGARVDEVPRAEAAQPIADDAAGREQAHPPSRRGVRARVRHRLGAGGWLQAVRADSLDRLASQHRETVAVLAHRGTIYDRTGSELALGSPAITVYANPRHIVDPRAAAVAGEEGSDLDPDKLYPLLADHSRGFVYVARQADAESARAPGRARSQGSASIRRRSGSIRRAASAASVVGYAGTSTTKVSPA